VESSGRARSGFPHEIRLFALRACFDPQIILARKGAVEGGRPDTGRTLSSWN
jgi:hypothetical protein